MPKDVGYIYLASPYTHTDPRVSVARYHEAKSATAYMLKNRWWTYSPIVHCHELALWHDLPTNFAFWRDYNFVMLGHANGLVVLGLEGWEQSTGVKGELQEAFRLGFRPRLMLRYGKGYTFKEHSFDAYPDAQASA